MNKYFQAGDLLFFEGAKIPKDVTEKKDGVILHSDTTGHSHKVIGPEAKLYLKDGKTYISTSEIAILTHPEHKDLALPPGNYEMRIVQEFDHLAEESRNVID